MNLTSLARPLIEIGSRLCAAGVLSGSAGNLSRRYPDGTRTDDGELVGAGSWIVTARGVHKGSLTPADFALLSQSGESLAGPEPSSEWQLHRAIYKSRPDVHAVVHAHPPYATALALAGIPLPPDLLFELAQDLGEVPLIPQGARDPDALLDAVRTHLRQANGALLARHGALTVGETPERAAGRMECLETAAQSHVLARLLLGAAPRGPG